MNALRCTCEGGALRSKPSKALVKAPSCNDPQVRLALQVFETLEPVFEKRPELIPVMVCSLFVHCDCQSFSGLGAAF